MSETASQLGDKLQDAQEQVGSMGRSASKKFAEARRDMANALLDSASSVRDTGEAIDELAERTAAKLDHSAAYVRNYDLGDLLLNIRQVICRHPAAFVTGAAAAGYLLGRVARKR